MEKQKKNIDDLFKEELGSYTETPPPMAWDALEKRLDGVPPRGTAVIFRRSLYLVMLGSVLLLSVSIAKKMMNSSVSSGTANIAAMDNANATTKAVNSTTGAIATTGNNQPVIPGAALPANAEKINNPGDNNQQANNAARVAQNKIRNKYMRHTQPAKRTAATAKKHNGNIYASSAGINSKTTNGANKNEELAEDQPEHVYNSSSPSNTDKDDDAANDKNKQEPVKKPTNNSKKQDDNQTPPPPPKPRPHFNRFEAGIKAGYESGFDNDAAKKLVISPYVQYNISPKFAIMLQPAVKGATIQSREIGNPASYYKENADSLVTPTTDRNTVHIFDGNNDSVWIYHYKYSQTHDSIVKSHNIGGYYSEYELPVLLKYKLSDHFSVYGGVNIVYSKTTSINEVTYTKKGILRTDSTFMQFGPVNGPAPAPQLPTSSIITYNENEISTYTNPYTSTQESLLRFGYMVGVSYDYKRWLFDCLVQQTAAPANVQAGYNINSALSSAYFRLTLGYKLTK